MRIVLFCHSLVSDWNHGNAHFLRGICRELIAQGHEIDVWEPHGGWSRSNLAADTGDAGERRFREDFPELSSHVYDPGELDLDRTLDGCDLAIVHEWSDPALVARIGRHRQRARDYILLFHDTHHRAVSAPEEMARFDLTGFDGVLAFGEVIRRLYLERGWAQRAWTWHEAADTRTFHPRPPATSPEDLVWVGNWGDDERTRELGEFLLDPARRLRLHGSIFGVRYPWRARLRIRRSGLRYRGWVANSAVPEVFARHRVTVHVPRGPYVRALPGIPTIRVFEALACGIPLVCSPWEDAENLFAPGEDFLIAGDGAAMTELLSQLLRDPTLRAALAERGLETIRARHTCAHRVAELLSIVGELRPDAVEGHA
jgi:spore maturation protein CgeB